MIAGPFIVCETDTSPRLIPLNKILLDEEKTKTVINFLEMLENDDDVQHVYANLELSNKLSEEAKSA